MFSTDPLESAAEAGLIHHDRAANQMRQENGRDIRVGRGPLQIGELNGSSRCFDIAPGFRHLDAEQCSLAGHPR
jgi:hypothetical protein